MQGLLEAVNRHSTEDGMRLNASKTRVMPVLIPSDGEPLEEVGKFKYLKPSLVTASNIGAYKGVGMPGLGSRLSTY